MHTNHQLANFSARLREEIRRADEGWAFPFEELAIELHQLQRAHNPAYRRFCEARASRGELTADWREIPAVPSAAFRELELTSLAPAERTAVFHSSGTTAQPRSRHFHSVESIFTYECSLVPWFRRHVLPEWGERAEFMDFLALTPAPAGAPGSSLVHMFATVQREFGEREQVFVGKISTDGAWSVDVATALEVMSRAVAAQRLLVLLGTAFSFVHLLDSLEEMKTRLVLPPGSRVLETGGYKGRSRELPKAELHALITDRVAVPASHIVCEYGMSELSSQAYDRVCGETQNPKPETRNFLFPPWCRAVVLSPETGREVADGETGLLRLFDLANVWSVLAIQTEDLAIRRGDGFELLGRATHAEARGCSLMAH
ncbi:MAG: long-chain fatty acid--CoA ligase [Verrucomicrobia bacterium]|nr:long-chain fatty acid--CoA ligase [Verrucomicrobiota bacterium]